MMRRRRGNWPRDTWHRMMKRKFKAMHGLIIQFRERLAQDRSQGKIWQMHVLINKT